MFLKFPDFNLYSTPLLILVVQGLILIALLLNRYIKKRNISDLFVAILLLTVCYQQICYTVGFMGWYNEFRNTKINYFLIPISLAQAPLIYFYVRSLTESNFKFKKTYWWHFAPVIALISYRFGIYFYDALQPGFHDTQNGVLKIAVDEAVIQPLLILIEFTQMLLYLAFTFQIYIRYRKNIQEFFSNTYKLELNWIRNFLIAFSLIFLYGAFQLIISSLIVELHYTQQWWFNLFMAVVTLYVGLMGYFTRTEKLRNLDFSFSPTPLSHQKQLQKNVDIKQDDIERIQNVMRSEKPFLNPELNLSELANMLNMSRGELSGLINSGFQMNFNDFVNSYRIENFKNRLKNGEHKSYNLLGIAMECGFNSKATFNRVFKKQTKLSPSEFLKTLN